MKTILLWLFRIPMILMLELPRLFFWLVSPMYRAISKMPDICKLDKCNCKAVKKIIQSTFIHDVIYKNSVFSRSKHGTLDDRLKYLFMYFDKNDPMFKAFEARIKKKALLNYKRKEKNGYYDGQLLEMEKSIDDNPQAIVESVLSKEMKANVFWWV